MKQKRQRKSIHVFQAFDTGRNTVGIIVVICLLALLMLFAASFIVGHTLGF